jgi:hypothetical protein
MPTATFNLILIRLCAVTALICCLDAAAQTAEIRRASNGKPDLTGIWAGPGFEHTGAEFDNPSAALYTNDNMAPLQSGAEALLYRPSSGDLRIDDPTALCLPNGLTRQIPSPYPQQWIQTEDLLVILYEYMHFFRTIPIGEPKRPHAEIAEATYMGDSIAWWEGDTLVIDTIGLKPWVLDAYHPDDGSSRWHSDQAHVVERITVTDGMNASYDVTIDDPVIFTAPWTQPWQMQRKPNWKLFEFICEDNNRCEGGVCDAADVQAQ